MITLLLVWLVQQASLGALGFVMEGTVSMHVSGVLHWENPFVAMRIIGSSCEELLVRGFVMLQVYALLRTRLAWPSVKASVTSIVLIGIGFAFFHVPRLITDGASAMAAASFLSTTLIMGLALGIVFARSGNVLVCMGLHCYVNLPLNVVTEPVGLPVIAEAMMTFTVMAAVIYVMSTAPAMTLIGVRRSPA